jgi:hypothetical protein
MGWTGVAIAVVAIVLLLFGDHSLETTRFAFVVGIFGLLVWCYMLRPRLVIGAAEVELRNAFSSWHVPLADVRRVAVRAVTMVYTDERRFHGVAVGRPVRSLRGGRQSKGPAIGIPGLGARYADLDHATPQQIKGNLDADGVADFVTEQILLYSDRARSVAHPELAPRRSWAWAELGALALLVVGLVVSLLL